MCENGVYFDEKFLLSGSPYSDARNPASCMLAKDMIVMINDLD
jgi:hypothetical protein